MKVILKVVQGTGLAMSLAGASAQGALVTEYFNSYGTTTTRVNSLGSATGGWAAGWTGANTYADYIPGTSLVYSGSGYAAPLNHTGAGNGTMAAGSGAGVTNVSYRALSSSDGGGLTGTVWISSLVYVASNTKDIFMTLDAPSQTNNAVALRGSTGTDPSNTLKVPEAVIKYNNVTDTTSTVRFAAMTTHLFLLKIGMNASGVNDSLDFWVDPVLGAGAPSSAAIYSKSGVNVFGTTFDGIGFTFASAGGSVDAIRISNDANGYAMVIPEPATLLLLCGLALPWLRRGRR